MKNGYAMVRRLKLTPFELRVAIDALNAKRLKQKANGIDNRATSSLILHLFDALEERSMKNTMNLYRGTDENKLVFFSVLIEYHLSAEK